MAKNGKVGDGHRDGMIRKRSQFFNWITGIWFKRDANTGRFMDGKFDGTSWKGVRREVNK